MTHVPNPVNLTTPQLWMEYANDASAGWFGIFILVAVFVIVLTHLMRNSTAKAFAASSLVTMTIAIFLRFMEVITDMTLFFTIAIFVLCVIWDGFTQE
jgi:hypothetical protein